MEKIKEIIYLPSLRCNLNCQHCGENQDIAKNDEINSMLVLQQLEASILLEVPVISISGGEPFLNNTIIQFIIEGIKRTNFKFNITTNGYFTEKIKETIENINSSDRDRVSFNISIDGLENTHNKIRRNEHSFEKAIESVTYLVEQGIDTSINVVVQKDNLNELEELERFFNQISLNIKLNFIPLAIDIAESGENIYTEEYQKNIWKRIKTPLEKKIILSKGEYKVKQCHAGQKNIVIGADGRVYACLTGAFYKGKEWREKFCLGDLKKSSLDEILFNLPKREEVYNKAVLLCKGCSNPCEVNREVHLFGQRSDYSFEEIQTAFKLEQEGRFGEALLDYFAWHDIEYYGTDNKLCWSKKLDASIFVDQKEKNPNKLSISYRKLIPDSKVKILLNGEEVVCDNDHTIQKQVVLDISSIKEQYIVITFLVDSLNSPSRCIGNGDFRYLGIGIEDLKIE
ncbi:radical SAM protein [Velocimicrobium porci]|uniref:Radical SAM protein n=1 Tax=Velocimicrobium porci TaxID=2606634 RepID=A0A6L5Y0X1_9FIRM|nr:radical SAM protein [Velocimicrobium porci]MSS64497.1 radical SAM protein [Velocimicrobium porci]